MTTTGSGHTFSEIFLHLNWHCLKDRPLITPGIEPSLDAFIEEYCAKVRGIHFKGVGGAETHIHLVFQFEPFDGISEFIGQVKGASSHEMNKQFGAGTIQWQRGFGIVSFSKKHLPAILRYVAGQKDHHAQGTANPTLEQSGEDSES
jgi:putative transposase